MESPRRAQGRTNHLIINTPPHGLIGPSSASLQGLRHHSGREVGEAFPRRQPPGGPLRLLAAHYVRLSNAVKCSDLHRALCCQRSAMSFGINRFWFRINSRCHFQIKTTANNSNRGRDTDQDKDSRGLLVCPLTLSYTRTPASQW